MPRKITPNLLSSWVAGRVRSSRGTAATMVQPSGLKWAALISQSLCPSWPPNENVAISPPEGTACSASSRSEEHTSELQSLMRISYAVFCLKKKNKEHHITQQKYVPITRVT